MSLSLDDLNSRYRAISSALDQSQRLSLPAVSAALVEARCFEVVGVGASEGPARLLVSVLHQLGIAARYVAISSFLSREQSPARAQAGLILFSQGLSPNAQIALSESRQRPASVLLTSITAAARPDRFALVQAFPGTAIVHPPEEESGSLVRLVGPLCAALTALRFAVQLAIARGGAEPVWFGSLKHVASAYAQIAEREFEPLGADPAACLAIGADTEFAPCLMWKWQEALYTRLPVAADVLSFAHGPLQSFYDERAAFFALCRDGEPLHSELWARLGETLHPERHRVLSVVARLPGPLALFEYDGVINGILLAEMRSRGIDPGTWPGQSTDVALYSMTGLSSKD